MTDAQTSETSTATTAEQSQETGSTEATTTATETAPTVVPKMFTQDQVGTLLAEEKRKVREQFADYDSLKESAGKVPDLESQVLRLQVGAERGLPLALTERLKGSTKAELEADATSLAAFLKPGQTQTFDGGVRETAPKTESAGEFMFDVLTGKKEKATN